MVCAFLKARRRPQFWEYPGGREFREATGQEKLPRAGAHVWLCPLESDAWLDKLLSAEELRRAENLVPRSKVPEFVLARGWLRALLAGYTGAANPQMIRIDVAGNGKPYAADFPRIHFNLSHSQGLAAIAFSAASAVGIDLEKIRPIPDWHDIAAVVLNASQRAAIAAVAPPQQETEFLRQFTAHEACFKAKGAGAAEHKMTAVPLPAIPGYTGHICLSETVGQ